MSIRRIAIIPARGGSKRIPGKNTREFCGKPMILHTLDHAKEAGIFSEIHVSTDSEDTATLVGSAGFDTRFLRPAELARDDTPIMPVLKYVLEAFVERQTTFDQVWMLMACSPLVAVDDYRKAAKMLDENTIGAALLAVAEYPVPIQWAFSRSTVDGSLLPVQPGAFSIRSQDLEKSYYDAGAFSAFPVEQVLSSQGAGNDSNFIGYPLDKNRVVDIDEEADWLLAEALYKVRTTNVQ